MNPNNCEACLYRKPTSPDCGWCYMFRNEPKGICHQFRVVEYCKKGDSNASN